MSDCKNEQVKMITNGTDEVAEVFLHGYLCNTIPRWKILPRPVKHKLMKKLGERNYNNIHDPRLYEDLDRIWKARKDMKDKDIIDRANLAVKVECAVSKVNCLRPLLWDRMLHLSHCLRVCVG